MDTRQTTTRAGAAAITLAFGAALAGCASGGGLQVESGPEGEIASHVPEGTVLNTELENRLSVTESEKGDQFHLTVNEPVVRGGVEVVPAGALIHGEVTAVHESSGAEDDPNVLKLHFYRIDVRGQSYPLSAEVVEANPSGTSTAENAAKIGAGAAAGAIVGAILGDEEGALIGGAVGAAAGTAVALGTSEEEGILRRGSRMDLRVTERIHLDEEN